LKRLALFAALLALAQCKRVPELGAAGSADTTGTASVLAVPDASGPPETQATPPFLPPPGSSRAGAIPPSGEPDNPLLAPPEGSIRFAVIGDFGAGGNAEGAVASMVKRWNPQFIITVGDNNYPAGEASTIDANVGQFYSDFIGNYHGRFGRGSPQNRFWPSAGNHDWMSGLGPYLEYFSLPGNERYYDVDLGLVHLYALDSDAREPDGVASDSRQAQWLKQKLAASKACYDVVYFHHPAYSTSDHGSALEMRWPFQKWGAEVVMAGHDHTYERLLVDGIPYFVNGLGGASKYGFPVTAMPETKFRYNDEFGAMRVTASDANIVYEFLTIDGKKRDALSVPGRCRR
jgi:hypothetical protein